MEPPRSAITPGTASSQFIEADQDDDFDEDIPGFSHPDPITPALKGKARAPDQLAPPGTSGLSSPNPLAGNIGASAAPTQPTRHMIAGVQVESRYTGMDTLDEPILTTLVDATFLIVSLTC